MYNLKQERSSTPEIRENKMIGIIRLNVKAGPKKPVVCDICGASMIGVHCKLRCPSCGFTRDCSDP